MATCVIAAAEIRKSCAAPEPTLVSCNDVFMWPHKLQSNGLKFVLSYAHVSYYSPVRLHRTHLELNKFYLLSGGHGEIRSYGVFWGRKTLRYFLQHRVHSHRKIRTRNTCPSSCGKTESAVLYTSQLIVTKTIVECPALAWTGLRMAWLSCRLKTDMRSVRKTHRVKTGTVGGTTRRLRVYCFIIPVTVQLRIRFIHNIHII